MCSPPYVHVYEPGFISGAYAGRTGPSLGMVAPWVRARRAQGERWLLHARYSLDAKTLITLAYLVLASD